MTINTNWQGRRCIIHIEQEMNIYTAASLKEPLLAPLSKSRELVLNLNHVSDMDTSGVQLLLLMHREAIRQHVALHILEMSAAVREVLSLYGLLSWFTHGENATSFTAGVRP